MFFSFKLHVRSKDVWLISIQTHQYKAVKHSSVLCEERRKVMFVFLLVFEGVFKNVQISGCIACVSSDHWSVQNLCSAVKSQLGEGEVLSTYFLFAENIKTTLCHMNRPPANTLCLFILHSRVPCKYLHTL